MMKKTSSLLVALLLVVALFAACGGGASSSQAQQSSLPQSGQSQSTPDTSNAGDGQTVTVAGLKGPTTMGMVGLMQNVEEGAAAHNYQVTMYGTADEIVTGLVGGDIQIAAIPANLASVLYNNSGGKVSVAAINTLGVLYVVETGDSVNSIADLAGKTVYSTGKGTTPEFALNYILQQNGLDPATDLNIEYKSESTEIAAILNAGEDAIAVLPQPYVTAVQQQNEDVRVALDLTVEWDAVSSDSSLVTGVLVANTAWLLENETVFNDFLAEYESSIYWVNENVAEAAELVAKYGIVEKAPIAEKAIPACNIVYVGGQDMKTQLAGYLQVLYNQNPQAVGGSLPGEDFYYLG